MTEAKEYRKMKTSELAQHLMRFRDDHAHSPNVEYRWLSAKSDDFVVLLCDVDEGTYSPETMKELKEFEAGIIELEIEAKRRELAKLEGDLKKARAA